MKYCYFNNSFTVFLFTIKNVFLYLQGLLKNMFFSIYI